MTCQRHVLTKGEDGAGDSVYGEKRISVEGEKEGEKIEYRVWNPFRSAFLLQQCSLRPVLCLATFCSFMW